MGDLPKERSQTDPSRINPLEARLVRRQKRGRLCVGVRAPGEMRHNPGQLEATVHQSPGLVILYRQGDP